jgi:formamidopyrimidine-DNA glycosylase
VPELPEVETARWILQTYLIGRRLTNIDLRLPKLLRESPIPDLTSLIGRSLVATRRRAKVMILDFDEELSLMLHLKLSGQVAVFTPDGARYIAGHPAPKPDGEYPHKATHAVFHWDDGSVFYLSDIRQFGWLRLMPTDDIEPALAAFAFGPESTDDLSGSPEIDATMRRRGIPIKTLLLDQSFIAGLGNIYVDEALFLSRIHPERPSSSLSKPERERLLAAIPPTIAAGLKQGGAKIIATKAYSIDNFPAVHGREGEPCFSCGTTIRKIRVGQRGTYYCPTCQKSKRPRVSTSETKIGVRSK